MGDARRADRRQRAPPHQQRRDCRCPQRHHRELRALAGAPAAAGLSLRHADRHRGHRASHPCLLRRRPAHCGSQGGRGISRRLCDCGDQHARARAHGRRACGQPLACRRRRARPFSCIRRDRACAGHAAGRLFGRRRCRRRDAREVRHLRCGRCGRVAPGNHGENLRRD